jgi:hypothetical protein
MPTWGEAWEKVLTAIRCYGSYRPAEGMASLDELLFSTLNDAPFFTLNGAVSA